jgi:PAS domain-containing protein
MDSNKTTVLLVDEDAREARQIQQAFSSLGEGRFQVERVGLLADALERLERLPAEVVLLSLAFGIEAVDQVVRAAPGAMLIVLGPSKNSDEEARLSKLHGAYDYLARGGFDTRGLPLLLGYVRGEKAAREAQRLAEKRFQAMSDASSQGICITDAKGICLYSNAAYHTLSGQSPDEITGQHWSHFVHPKDRPRALTE